MNMNRHPVYRAWQNMKDRCINKNAHNYRNYGARGIKVCKRWMISKNFIDDMFPTWSEGLQLDRIDNDGNYDPSNCRWADRETQLLNRRAGLRGTSKYRGVIWYSKMKKWRAQIGYKHKNKHIGYFDTEIDAAIAFDAYIVSNNLPNKLNFSKSS